MPQEVDNTLHKAPPAIFGAISLHVIHAVSFMVSRYLASVIAFWFLVLKNITFAAFRSMNYWFSWGRKFYKMPHTSHSFRKYFLKTRYYFGHQIMESFICMTIFSFINTFHFRSLLLEIRNASITGHASYEPMSYIRLAITAELFEGALGI